MLSSLELMYLVHHHCLTLPGHRGGMWLQSFRGSSAHNQLSHCRAYPEAWRWAAVEKMNWAIFHRTKSIASEQPATPAAGAGRGGERSGGGERGSLEEARSLPWRGGGNAGVWREEGGEGQREGLVVEEVVPERIWIKWLYSFCLKLPPLLRTLSVEVGCVRCEGETHT